MQRSRENTDRHGIVSFIRLHVCIYLGQHHQVHKMLPWFASTDPLACDVALCLSYTPAFVVAIWLVVAVFIRFGSTLGKVRSTSKHLPGT